MAQGSVEKETVWVKSNGELIDVWVIGKVVAGSKGSITHTRFVAQDMTLNRLLEAELQEKNGGSAEANDELSQRNRELDEFVYVVSHDLQEPLRTLIAFSDFLMKDYGDRLETEGQEYVRYLVDASRRMRAMIHGNAQSLPRRQGDRRIRHGGSGRADGRDQGRPGRAFRSKKRRAAGQGSAARRSGATATESASCWQILIGNGSKIQPELESVGRGRSEC